MKSPTETVLVSELVLGVGLPLHWQGDFPPNGRAHRQRIVERVARYLDSELASVLLDTAAGSVLAVAGVEWAVTGALSVQALETFLPLPLNSLQ